MARKNASGANKERQWALKLQFAPILYSFSCTPWIRAEPKTWCSIASINNLLDFKLEVG
jgi:hypothetical protein